MKTSVLFLVCAFLLIRSLFAQDNPSQSRFKFGVAATLEKSSDIYDDGFHQETNVGFSKMLIPVIYKSTLKIEAEFGYRSRNSREFADYTLWQFGLGAYYFFRYGEIHIYAGPRFGFEKLLSNIFSADAEMSAQTYSNFGLTFGSEYFLAKHFSVGGEIQINKYIFSPAEIDDFNVSYVALVPLLYLSVYFQ